MTSFDDESEAADGAETNEALEHELRTKGAWTAYRTNVAICDDPNAPANAKAQAASSLFRAAGLFANREPADQTKNLSEMSPEEINAELRRVRASLDRRLARRGKALATNAAEANIFD